MTSTALNINCTFVESSCDSKPSNLITYLLNTFVEVWTFSAPTWLIVIVYLLDREVEYVTIKATKSGTFLIARDTVCWL
jgi:hypothetical protein